MHNIDIYSSRFVTTSPYVWSSGIKSIVKTRFQAMMSRHDLILESIKFKISLCLVLAFMV